MILTADVEYIIKKINDSGYRADVVGGPVRDFLLGKTPDDYDITTNATPDKVKEIFSSDRTVDTGIKHGTVTLVLKNGCYEITTYRIDGEYKDSRHPEYVSFTARIEDDLARRDFTVNAIAYNPDDGITDPYGGRADIDRRIIRAVGDPEKRFSEDALRILRAIRFSATLGFDIEEGTKKAIFEKMHLLHGISAERIFTEFKKMLGGDHAYCVIEEFKSVVKLLMPGLENMALPKRSSFESADWESRIMAIYYLSCENPAESFVDMSYSLKTDAALRERGKILLGSVDKYDIEDKFDLRLALMELGEANLRALIRLHKVLSMSDGSSEKALDDFLAAGLPYRISDLEIGGADLIALGFCGREIGDELSRLLKDALCERVENEKNALTALAVKHKMRT